MRWTDLLERLKRATGLSDRHVASLEKRRGFRISQRIVLVGVRSDGENLHLVASNFGVQGLRVECSQRLKKDDRLSLFTQEQPEDARRGAVVRPEPPHARVVWVRKRKDPSVFDLGLAFILDTPTQRKSVAHFLLHDCRLGLRNARENRRMPRIHFKMGGQLTTADCNTSEVVVKDVSVGGALILSPRELARNTTVELTINLPETTPALQCKGTVVRSLKVGRVFELGVSFTAVASDHQDRLVACLSRLLTAERTS